MFDRLPKPRKTFDPFNQIGSGSYLEKNFKFKRKRLSIRKSGTSIARLVIMFLAVIWFIYYLAK
ncbi:MAG: hypothetical protein IIC39_02180 [Candidatus Marinimicrobia bacterium]|nr:hypothetical protein [Candidatus Neomarinimicrobiota bacterium]MCH8306220.1 hypothetical protein [Candidatus Neomarinimicrobiota bacterium]